MRQHWTTAIALCGLLVAGQRGMSDEPPGRVLPPAPLLDGVLAAPFPDETPPRVPAIAVPERRVPLAPPSAETNRRPIESLPAPSRRTADWERETDRARGAFDRIGEELKRGEDIESRQLDKLDQHVQQMLALMESHRRSAEQARRERDEALRRAEARAAEAAAAAAAAKAAAEAAAKLAAAAAAAPSLPTPAADPPPNTPPDAGAPENPPATSPLPVTDNIVDTLALADSLFAQGRFTDALAFYQEAAKQTELPQQQAWVDYQLGSCNRILGDLELAQSHYRRVSGMTVETPFSGHARRWLEHIQGQRDVEQRKQKAESLLQSFRSQRGETR